MKRILFILFLALCFVSELYAQNISYSNLLAIYKTGGDTDEISTMLKSFGYKLEYENIDGEFNSEIHEWSWGDATYDKKQKTWRATGSNWATFTYEFSGTNTYSFEFSSPSIYTQLQEQLKSNGWTATEGYYGELRYKNPNIKCNIVLDKKSRNLGSYKIIIVKAL